MSSDTKENEQDKSQNKVSQVSKQGDMYKRHIDLDGQKRLMHHQLLLEGVEVFFPFKPYQIQQDYMQSVLKALNDNSNALLQSPTGTGKTLSLLCATLGWLRHQRKNPKPENPPFNRIIFCSRTHAQLKQVMRELKFTAYKPKICILASRDQYCMKKEFSQLKDLELNGACKKAIKEKSCQFYNYSGQGGRQQQHILDDVLDIEDLQLMGSASCSTRFCPYYYSREIKDEADVVILPYSFLLQQNRFQDFQVILKDSIIIFDEAHNVPSAAEEGTSYKIDDNLLMESLKELQYLDDNMNNMMRTTKQDIQDARQLIRAFSKLIIHFESEGKVERLKDGSMGRVSSVKELFDMIEQIGGYLFTNAKNNSKYDKKRVQYDKYFKKDDNQKVGNQESYGKKYFDHKEMLPDLKNQRDDRKKEKINGSQKNLLDFNFKRTTNQSSEPGVNFLKKSVDYENNQEEKDLHTNEKIATNGMSKILKISKQLSKIIADMQTMKCQNIDFFAGFIVGICKMYDQDQDFKNSLIQTKLSDFYKFFFHKASNHHSEKSSINLWCLDPSIAFRNIQIQQPHSIILTSGTLHPMNSWDAELNLEFKIKLTTDHVIDIKKSVIGGILKTGLTDIELNFSFSNRSNNAQYEELGELLIQLSRSVPNGILVCFSSGSLMKLTQEAWISSSSRIISRLKEIKEVFFEPKSNQELQRTMQQYIKNADDDQRGAILFCVCRGKISEGIDFTDKLARCVVIIGVPFPPSADTRVCTKMEYLDNKMKDQSLKLISGKEWYTLNTIRAMNQAIGRVIRHKDDYGGVILCDARFSQSQFKGEISGWIRPVLNMYPSAYDLIQAFKAFFGSKQIKLTSLDQVLKLGESKSESSVSSSILEIALNQSKQTSQINRPQEIFPLKFINIPYNTYNSQITNPTKVLESQHNFTKIFLKGQQEFLNQNQNQEVDLFENMNVKVKTVSPGSSLKLVSKEVDKFDSHSKINENIVSLEENQRVAPQGQNKISSCQKEQIISITDIYKKIDSYEKQTNQKPLCEKQPPEIKKQCINNKNVITNCVLDEQQRDSLINEEKRHLDGQKILTRLNTNWVKRRSQQIPKYGQEMMFLVDEKEQDEEDGNIVAEENDEKKEQMEVEVKGVNPIVNEIISHNSTSLEQPLYLSDSKSVGWDSLNKKRKIIISETKEHFSTLGFKGLPVCDNQFNSKERKLRKLKPSSITKESLGINDNIAYSEDLNEFCQNKFNTEELREVNEFRIEQCEKQPLGSEQIMQNCSEKQISRQSSNSSESISFQFLSDVFKEETNGKESESMNGESSIQGMEQKRSRSLKVTPQQQKEEGNVKSSATNFQELLSRQSFKQKQNIQELQNQKYHKVMMSNTSRGLASFHEGHIMPIKHPQVNNIQKTPNNTTNTIINQALISSNPTPLIEITLPESNDKVCPICYEIPIKNQRSNICGHTACMKCWQRWLSEQLTCPLCRVRCRLPYLEPCG